MVPPQRHDGDDMQSLDGVDILEIEDDLPAPQQAAATMDDTVQAATTLVDTTRALSSTADEREPLVEATDMSTRRDAPAEEHVWTSPRRSGRRAPAPARSRARPMSAPSTAQHRIQRTSSAVGVDEEPQLITVGAPEPLPVSATEAATAFVVGVSEPLKPTGEPPVDHRENDAVLLRRSSAEWIKYHTEDGDEYYYNARTHESQWTRPPGVTSPTASTTSSSASMTTTTTTHSHSHSLSYNDVSSAGHEPLRVPPEELFELLAQSSDDHAATKLETMLRRALPQAIDWNVRNAAGLSPLHVAVQSGSARACALLLDHGASAYIDVPLVRGDASAETPLMMACRANVASLVRLLTRYRASTAVRDADGNTLLHLAVRCWSDNALLALLEVETVITAALDARNAEDETPLHLAARHGNAVAVRALLAAGASADQEDAHGRTPLVVSIMENRVECAQLLQLAHAPVAHSDDQGELLDVSHEAEREQAQAAAAVAAAALSVSGEPELDAMQSYLLQVVETTADAALVASAVYQYVETAQRHVHAWRGAAKSAELKHENLRLQLDVLRKSQLVLQAENATLTEERDALAQQLDAKERERATLQTAFSGLSSRAAMLESIARTAQDKLRRERVEHVQQEAFWMQTIDASLRENQALLTAVQALQPQWQRSNQTDVEPAPSESYEHQHQRLLEEEKDSIHSQQQQQQQRSTSTDSVIDADADVDVETDRSLLYVDPMQSDDVDTLSSSSLQVAVAAGSVSPSRVDAVWNRFFENMSRVAESDATSATTTAASASALFAAVRKGSHDRLQALLLSGTSPNVRDIGERGTPLHLACELGDVDAVLLLCECGADLETRDETGNTPLLVASAQGHEACVRFLLQSAANMAVRNDAQDSALHLAAWDGSAECVEMLLEYGASVLAVNALGLTALSNLKTRSPLRHRFEELTDAHPMKRTLSLLEYAEREATMAMEKSEKKKLSKGRGKEEKESKKKTNDAPASERRESWGRWLLGSVFGARKSDPLDDEDQEDGEEDADAEDDGGDARLSETAEPSDDADEDEQDGDVEEGDATVAASSALYRQLTPPPEVEAALRHHAARRSLSSSSSSASALPPPPPEVLDALQRRQKGFAFDEREERSPRATSTRFASPATATLHRKRLLRTTDGRKSMTDVRARYVDTFNNTSATPP